jgi:hypothetical protein
LLAGLIDWLAASGITAWAGGAAYPVINTLHLLGLVLLLGGIGVVDLAILGLLPRLPAAALATSLTPFAVAGFALLVATGSLLFAADAQALAGSAVFRWKLIGIGGALLNVLAFRLVRDAAAQRVMALVSLLAWLLVATLGRMIAYT